MTEATALAKRESADVVARLDAERRAFKSLQSRYDLLEDELQSSHVEIDSLKEEMSAYKTKAQAVLKQAKSDRYNEETSRTHRREMEAAESRRKELEAEVEALQREVREAIDESDSVKAEMASLSRLAGDLQRQLGAATERHRAAIADAEREKMAAKSTYDQSLIQLNERRAELLETQREKLRRMEEDHKAEVEALQRVSHSNEQEVFRLQKELQIALAVGTDSVIPSSLHHGSFSSPPSGGGGLLLSPPPGGVAADGDAVHQSSAASHQHPLRGTAFMSSLERQEGEGMEHTDDDRNFSPTPSQSGHHPFVPFDQLLSAPTSPPPVETLSLNSASKRTASNMWPTEEGTVKTLHEELATTAKKVQHLTELLRESEATNARLSEESKMLKAEIRRSERNRDRKSELDNVEYLKNVVFKFLALDADREQRLQLVPVLTTLLKLSPEERRTLTASASGDAASTANNNAGGGPQPQHQAEGGSWSGYFHRWSGLM